MPTRHVSLSSEIKSTYWSVRLPNICTWQLHCPHAGTILSSCNGKAPAWHLRGNFTAMRALVGRSKFASAEREPAQSRSEWSRAPRPRRAGIRALPPAWRENTRLTDGFLELYDPGAVQPQCCSVCVGDAPQHRVCSVFNTRRGLVEFSRSRRQHPTKHVAIRQPMLRRKNHSDHIGFALLHLESALNVVHAAQSSVHGAAARRPDPWIRPLRGGMASRG